MSLLLSRILWHLNRSPLAPLVAAFFTCRRLRSFRQRRSLAHQLSISSQCADRAAALNRDGFVLVDDLVDKALLARLATTCHEKLQRLSSIAERQEIKHKSFWTRLLDEDLVSGAFPPESLPVQVALQRPIIELLTSALKAVPQLSDVIVTLSEHSRDPLSYSQLWHRDYDSARTLKFFVYLSDVGTDDDGPFTFVPAPISARVGYTLRSHMRDDALLRHIKSADIKCIVGPKLTAFVVETSRCMHMGSRLGQGRRRLMYTATFISAPRPYPEPPPRFRVSDGADRITSTLLTS